MSVFTKVAQSQLDDFLTHYTVGKCVDFKPIAAGVTNTNYFLDTDSGKFVLTLYEHHSDDELDYILGLQQHLVNRGVRCSSPVTDRRGDFYSTLNNRPAAIIQRLAGETPDEITQNRCESVASELARFHIAGQDFQGYRPNPRGFDWLVAVRDMLDHELDSDDQSLISMVFQDYQRLSLDAIPGGPIHADLFHDNALFSGDHFEGILDFDYACHDSFVFDLATTINDWCTLSDGSLDMHLTDALLQAYQKERPLKPEEVEALPVMLRITALRFWLSRLYDKVFPLSGELTFIKDPNEYRHLLSLYLARNLSDTFIFAT
ncbi:MAG: homoserine kinase [Pseudomonadota bacterium]